MTRIDGRIWPSRRVTGTGDSDRRAHLAVEAGASDGRLGSTAHLAVEAGDSDE